MIYFMAKSQWNYLQQLKIICDEHEHLFITT